MRSCPFPQRPLAATLTFFLLLAAAGCAGNARTSGGCSAAAGALCHDTPDHMSGSPRSGADQGHMM